MSKAYKFISLLSLFTVACGPVGDDGETCSESWWEFYENDTLVLSGNASSIVYNPNGGFGINTFNDNSTKSCQLVSLNQPLGEGIKDNLVCIMTDASGGPVADPQWLASLDPDGMYDFRPNIITYDKHDEGFFLIAEGNALKIKLLSHQPPYPSEISTVLYRFVLNHDFNEDLQYCVQLSYPSDCNSAKLRRACEKNGCSVENGGEHLLCYNPDKTSYIPIGHTVKENETCRKIIKFINKWC